MCDPLSFKLFERPNLEKLKQVLASPYLYNPDLPALFKYYREAEKAGSKGIEITYSRKCYNGRFYGRFYPHFNNQKLKFGAYQWGAIRSEIFCDETVDVDAKSCHPSILHRLCLENNIPCKVLPQYLHDRQPFFDNLNIKQDDINIYNEKYTSNLSLDDGQKIIFTMVIYGASTKEIQKLFDLQFSPFPKKGIARDLYNEITQLITKSIVSLPQYVQLKSDIIEYKNSVFKSYHNGTFLSFILQDKEVEYIIKAMNMFETYNIPVIIYIYDGFQIMCKDLDRINDVISKINILIPIQMVVKPFKKPLSSLTFKNKLRTDDDIKSHMLLLTNNENIDVYFNTFKTSTKVIRNGKTIYYVDDDDSATKAIIDSLTVNDICYFKKIDTSGNTCYMLSEQENQWVNADLYLSKYIQELDLYYTIAPDKFGGTKPPQKYVTKTTTAKRLNENVRHYVPLDDTFIIHNNEKIKDYLFFQDCLYHVPTKTEYDYDDELVKDIKPFYIIPHNFKGQLLDLDDPKIFEVSRKIFACFEWINNECPEMVYTLKVFSRALTGHFEDKVFYIFSGERNSGKGTMQGGFTISFGQYVTICDPPIVMNTSSDFAMINRTAITYHHDIARLAFSNDSHSTLKDPKLDGDAIKRRFASGGDTFGARTMGKNEITMVQNAICVFTFNKVPECSVPDALRTMRVIETNGSFTNEFTDNAIGNIKADDPTMKSWIKTNPLVPRVMISLIIHYWSSTQAKDITQPLAFIDARDELCPQDTDPSVALNTHCVKDPNGWLSADDALEKVFMNTTLLTPHAITKFMAKAGFIKAQKLIPANPLIKDSKPSRPYGFKGVQLKTITTLEADLDNP